MQIKEENMVEDISNLLNTGEVPNLFDSGEQASIGENIRSKAKKAKMDGSRQDLYAFFLQEVKAHLHIVLAFSPVGDAFRNRLRLFPSLVTCMTINWFAQWPHDALESVAEKYLEVRFLAGCHRIILSREIIWLTLRVSLLIHLHFLAADATAC